MYEFTHGGVWFRWNALDGTSRRLMSASFAASSIAVWPLIVELVGTKGLGLNSRDVTFSVGVAVWMIGFSLLAALAWWRFSLRQDEMFNRVQNWSFAMAGGWSIALLTIWDTLDRANVIPSTQPWTGATLFLILWSGFWFMAVRRWA